ncbi:DNA-directed primase/polymerase protein isoform X2 [Pistacia vera]|uniref:DNA-directed primase/polymerase protein isoform X2 n=1 Tax=Pistacia vera TaxID=55513 RepID=UPI001263B505|nr:DNA-directed primase/polymerase protein isoform X2 [Pistacia vera]
MDDVDRLFQCFKCGISPPPSAMRERKRRKNKPKQEGAKHEVFTASGTPSPRSACRGKTTDSTETDIQLCPEELGLSTVKVNKSNCGGQISPVVFYGTPNGVPRKRPLSLLRLLHEIRVDLSKQDKSDLRKEVWATFPRQDEAIKFVKGHANVHIYSYQDHFNGQRRFLVSTYKEFWQRYKTMDPNFRHHYEVIQEGLPCHLYFDLEFNKRDNPEKDGDEMVDLLISITLQALLDKYSIEGNEDWIIELDSSTTEKFSRHLIMRMPKTAFKDNSHAGAFVTEICSRIRSARERDANFEKLFIKKDSNSAESPSQLFVDTAVYSRNRCFRLALSSKAGKNSFLLPTGRFKCKGMCEEDMFMASLICNMDADCDKLLVCKLELDCVKTLQFDTELHNNYGKYCRTSQEFALSSHSSDVSTTYFMGKSPFPALDKFIECIASIGDVSVMYVVDLRRAVYYQKCYDPDCRGYRSPLRPIPLDSIPDPMFSSDSRQMMQHGGLTDNNIEYQLVNNYWEQDMSCYDDDNTESCGKDSWWIEAINLANDIENKQKTWDSSNMANIDDEDDGWWMAVERTASQAELMHFN